MSELLVMTCSTCKSEARFVLPLPPGKSTRWNCNCESFDPAARFTSFRMDGPLPEKYLALDAVIRQCVAYSAAYQEPARRYA